jgi:hypothetical protein
MRTQVALSIAITIIGALQCEPSLAADKNSIGVAAIGTYQFVAPNQKHRAHPRHRTTGTRR